MAWTTFSSLTPVLGCKRPHPLSQGLAPFLCNLHQLGTLWKLQKVGLSGYNIIDEQSFSAVITNCCLMLQVLKVSVVLYYVPYMYRFQLVNSTGKDSELLSSTF